MINWNEAPIWANYHAFDYGRKGVWHQSQPDALWIGWDSDGLMLYSGHRLPAGVNWQKTLVSKQATSAY